MTVHECTILGLFKCMAIGRQGGSLFHLSSTHVDRSDFGGEFLRCLSRLSIEIIIMWKLKGFKCPLS